MRVYQALVFVGVSACLSSAFVPASFPALPRGLATSRQQYRSRVQLAVVPKAVAESSDAVQSAANSLQSLQSPLLQLKLDTATLNKVAQSTPLGSVATVDPAVIQQFVQANMMPLGAALAVFLVAAVSSASTPKLSTPYPKGGYDYKTARAYFDQRPGLVLSRTFELLYTSGGFGLSLLLDSLTNNIENNEEKRAQTLTTLLTRLGPTFIKIGQSLSIRTDLLPIKYIRALQQVCLHVLTHACACSTYATHIDVDAHQCACNHSFIDMPCTNKSTRAYNQSRAII
jgi:hypothetical protein